MDSQNENAQDPDDQVPSGPPPDDDELTTALAQLDGGNVLMRPESGSVALLNRSEIETQMDAAHRYPRSIKRFMQQALTLATLTRRIAESCIYSLPRSGKPIVGPSVRLAEICAGSYGNVHVGARPMEVRERDVIAQGMGWDLETNFRVTTETTRRITNKSGGRYNDDMIQVTLSAATSIAFRNAIFRTVPRSYIDTLYGKIALVATGGAKELGVKRKELFDRFAAMGVEQPRVLAAVERAAVDDVTLEDVEYLIGLGTAIAQKDRTIEECFPVASQEAPEAPAAQEGRRVPLGRGRRREPAPGDGQGG